MNKSNTRCFMCAHARPRAARFRLFFLLLALRLFGTRRSNAIHARVRDGLPEVLAQMLRRVKQKPAISVLPAEPFHGLALIAVGNIEERLMHVGERVL